MFNIGTNLQELKEMYADKFNEVVVADNMTLIPIRTFNTLEELFNLYPAIEITATELIKEGFGDYTTTNLWIYG